MNNNNTQKAEIVDIKMSFLSKAEFMIKAAMKPIPAMTILIFTGALSFGVLGGLMRVIGGY